MQIRHGCLVAALVLSCGCGKQEREEAIRFHRVLAEQRASFAESNSLEKDYIGSVRGWCESIVANGSGRGAALDQNASVARDLAKSADSISTKIGLVRQAVYDLSLQKEYTQGVRSALISQLTKRQRFLQEFRSSLEESAKGFEALGQSRGYQGDSYPNALTKVIATAQSYRAPGDAVAEAISALTTKYSLKDSDLGPERKTGEPGTS